MVKVKIYKREIKGKVGAIHNKIRYTYVGVLREIPERIECLHYISDDTFVFSYKDKPVENLYKLRLFSGTNIEIESLITDNKDEANKYFKKLKTKYPNFKLVKTEIL